MKFIEQIEISVNRPPKKGVVPVISLLNESSSMWSSIEALNSLSNEPFFVDFAASNGSHEDAVKYPFVNQETSIFMSHKTDHSVYIETP